MILQRQAKNGHTVEVDEVPAVGLNGEQYIVTAGADNYFIALDEELWHLVVQGTAHWLNPTQISALLEGWLITLVDEMVTEDDAESFGL